MHYVKITAGLSKIINHEMNSSWIKVGLHVCILVFLQDVTQDFCKWVSDLGGESNNIEESTIYSLFASGCVCYFNCLQYFDIDRSAVNPMRLLFSDEVGVFVLSCRPLPSQNFE